MKKILIALIALSSSACTQADLSTEPTPPPAPQAPTVTINVIEDSVSAGQPVRIALCGTHFTEIRVSPGGFTVARCDTLTDYPARSVRYRAFAPGLNGQNAQASDSVTVKTTTTPPAPTTATGWMTSNFYPTRVDSVWIYSKTGGRTTALVNKDLPYNITLPADSGVYIYWNSAEGHYPEPVSVVPVVGHPINEKAVMRPVPPPSPTPPTTESVLIASSPSEVTVAVSEIQLDGSWKLWKTVHTDTVVELPEGHYRAEFAGPEGYLDGVAYTDVKPGDPAMPLVAVLAKKPTISNPPPVPTTGTLLVACPIPGVKAFVVRYGTDTRVGSGTPNFELTLEPGIYLAKFDAPAGYVSKPVPPVAVNTGQRSVTNCNMERIKEGP